MNEIEELRRKIDNADILLVGLFEKRMSLCSRIGALKKENSLPVQDSSRESVVIENALASLSDASLEPYCRRLMELLVEMSREYQSLL